MKKISLSLLCAILVFCFAGTALAYLQPGSKAPDFELLDLNGNKVRLSEFKGKIIVLKLGTTWCPDCVAQDADLLKIGPFLRDHDAVLVDVFIQENRQSVSRYLEGKDFAMPVLSLLDDGQAHRGYQVYLIPRLLIIDQQFRIAHDGLRLQADDLKEKIAALAPAPKQESTDPDEKKSPCPVSP